MTNKKEKRYVKPFLTSYVLKKTFEQIINSIEWSKARAYDRLLDFPGNEDKTTEVFTTIHRLNLLKSILMKFRADNPEWFKRP